MPQMIIKDTVCYPVKPTLNSLKYAKNTMLQIFYFF